MNQLITFFVGISIFAPFASAFSSGDQYSCYVQGQSQIIEFIIQDLGDEEVHMGVIEGNDLNIIPSSRIAFDAHSTGITMVVVTDEELPQIDFLLDLRPFDSEGNTLKGVREELTGNATDVQCSKRTPAPYVRSLIGNGLSCRSTSHGYAVDILPYHDGFEFSENELEINLYDTDDHFILNDNLYQASLVTENIFMVIDSWYPVTFGLTNAQNLSLMEFTYTNADSGLDLNFEICSIF